MFILEKEMIEILTILALSQRMLFKNFKAFIYGGGLKIILFLPILPNSLSLKLFLRGLFDTDGSLKFSKQSKNINYYPRIQYAFKESDFSRDLGTFLSQAGFTFCRWYDKRDKEYYYQISGDSFLHTWIKTVGLSNPVHYSKYLYWKRFGYFIPRSSLAFRMNALHLKTEDLF